MNISALRRTGRRKILSLAGIAGLAVAMSGCTLTTGFVGVQGNPSNALSGLPVPITLTNGSASLTLFCGATINKRTGNCAGRNVGSIGNQPFVSVAAVGGTLAIPSNVLPHGAEAGLVLGLARYGTDPQTGNLVSQPNALYLDLSLEAAPRSPQNTSLIAVITAPQNILTTASRQLTAQDVSSVSAALSFVQRQTGTDFSAWNTFLQQHPYLTGVTRLTTLPGIPGSTVVAGFQCANCATVIPGSQQININVIP